MQPILLHRSRRETRKFVSGLRGKLVLIVLGGILLALLMAASVIVGSALQQRQSLRDRVGETATALAQAIDQELSGYLQLLRGLSKSPAIQAGDLRSLYDQLRATPTPPGVWLIYADTERQLLHARLPFGTQLQRLRPGTADRIRQNGWSVSERTVERYFGSHAFAISLRVDDPEGVMSNVLTCIVSDERMVSMLSKYTVPVGWRAAIADRDFNVIAPVRVRDKSQRDRLDASVIDALQSGSSQPVVVASNVQEGSRVVAYSRASISGLIATVSVPLHFVDAPMTSAVRQLAYGGLFVILLSSVLGWIIASRLQQPVELLRKFAAFTEVRLRSAEAQLQSTQAEYSHQLAALQEEERRRIAAELHDSTQQHLVALDLYLGQLRKLNHHIPAAAVPLQQMAGSIERAQKELRIFTYLLYPPDLAAEGLKESIQLFVEGFTRRTGLSGDVEICELADALPLPIQQCVLRVVQEALSNVHRHAEATWFRVDVEVIRSMLRLRVTDNGRGLVQVTGSGQPGQLGVGIPGMRSRLKQFGGVLRIESSVSGTTLVATILLSAPCCQVECEKVRRTATSLTMPAIGDQHA